MKPSEITSRLISRRLDEVLRLHPVIESVCEEIGIPLFAVNIRVATNYPGLLGMLARTPIPVVCERNQLYCTGNVRAFFMAQALLPPESKISCIEYLGETAESIRKTFLSEFIYQPAVFGVQKAGVGVLAQAGRQAFEKGFLEKPLTSVETHFSNLYRVDRRTLIPKPKATQKELAQAINVLDESAQNPENDIN